MGGGFEDTDEMRPLLFVVVRFGRSELAVHQADFVDDRFGGGAEVGKRYRGERKT